MAAHSHHWLPGCNSLHQQCQSALRGCIHSDCNEVAEPCRMASEQDMRADWLKTALMAWEVRLDISFEVRTCALHSNFQLFLSDSSQMSCGCLACKVACMTPAILFQHQLLHHLRQQAWLVCIKCHEKACTWPNLQVHASRPLLFHAVYTVHCCTIHAPRYKACHIVIKVSSRCSFKFQGLLLLCIA